MRARARRNHVSQDRWLISYADFITLLFGLFVVLFAFSRADEKKQVEVSEAIDSGFKALGIFPEAARKPTGSASSMAGNEKPPFPMNIVMGEEVLSPARVKDDLENLQKELTQRLSNQVSQHTVSIKMGRDGLVISLREAGFFDSGSAVPRAESMGTLHQIGDSLRRIPYDLRVEGHTDNIPIRTTEFDSNWELSSARATRVARTFLNFHAVSANRLSAAGYAEFHPVADNATAEGRASNRRVDLVVLPRTKVDFSQPSAANWSGKWVKITDDR